MGGLVLRSAGCVASRPPPAFEGGNMIALYFGLPGCGKTTLLSSMALKALKGKKYKNVYCNIPLAGDPLFEKMIPISASDIGKYLICDGLVLIDESLIAWNSRQYAKFSMDVAQYFVMHRHYNVDLCLFSQRADGVDLTIRSITDRVYYVSKKFITGLWWTNIVRVPYDIIFPDPKSDRVGEIVQGYRKPPFFTRMFAQHLFRPKYYKYFDSWERPDLPELPAVVKRKIQDRYRTDVEANKKQLTS